MAPRRGGRVVDRTALEMRHRCKPIGGSNPSLSATKSLILHKKIYYTELCRHFRRSATAVCGSWPLREQIFRDSHGQLGRFLRLRLCRWLSLQMMVSIKCDTVAFSRFRARYLYNDPQPEYHLS